MIEKNETIKSKNTSGSETGVKSKLNLRFQRDKESEKVKGIFRYYEVPGGSMNFVYKKFKGDDVIRYDLIDGAMYELPLGVAKHLNNNGWYPEHSYIMDENGQPSMRVGKKVRRFGFESLEFIDIEDIKTEDDIVTVEKM